MESLPREERQERRQRAGQLRSEEPLERLGNKDARPGWGRSSWRQAGRLGQREQRSWQAGGQAWMRHWRSKLRQQKDKAETEWGYTRLESLGTDRMLCRTLSSLTDLHLLDASWTSQLWKTKVSPEIARCFLSAYLRGSWDSNKLRLHWSGCRTIFVLFANKHLRGGRIHSELCCDCEGIREQTGSLNFLSQKGNPTGPQIGGLWTTRWL